VVVVFPDPQEKGGPRVFRVFGGSVMAQV